MYLKKYYLSYQFVSAATGKRYFEYPVSDISAMNYNYANNDTAFRKQLRRVFSNYTEPKYIDKWHQKIIVGKTGNEEFDRHISNVIAELLSRVNINITQSNTVASGNILVHFYDGSDEEYQLGFGQREKFFYGWKYKLHWPSTVYVDRKLDFKGITIETVVDEEFVLYRDAVPFTYNKPGQVEGYYQVLPGSAGNITKSECYIFDKHEINLKKSLITECIVRSLGFSGLTNGDSILSDRDSWGEIYVYPTELDYFLLNILYNTDAPRLKRENLFFLVKDILFKH